VRKDCASVICGALKKPPELAGEGIPDLHNGNSYINDYPLGRLWLMQAL
jgi:hypothetical protein